MGSELNKPIGDGPTYAESWEIVDHGDYQSIVSFGPLAGMKLGDLVRLRGPELLGDAVVEEIADPRRPPNLVNRFPLLFKFLDANQNLSVQVHPDDRMGATLSEPDLGKTEAWYVLGASPGARVYAGLKPDVTRPDLQAAIEANRAEDLLHSFEPQPGDCIFIPAGTVHALGQGLLIAEIQQCSNTTFRLYDWGRVDRDGKPRELHIEQGLEAINYETGPVGPQVPHVEEPGLECLVECDKFRMNRLHLNGSRTIETSGAFRILAVVSGSARVSGDPGLQPMQKGDTCLIPASAGMFELSGDKAEILLIEPATSSHG